MLNQFRSGRLNVLVATDVAARGLDVKDIETVVNYGKLHIKFPLDVLVICWYAILRDWDSGRWNLFLVVRVPSEIPQLSMKDVYY